MKSESKENLSTLSDTELQEILITFDGKGKEQKTLALSILRQRATEASTEANKLTIQSLIDRNDALVNKLNRNEKAMNDHIEWGDDRR
jgi:hypothetical protein